jgi:hypothetical protein
VRHFVATLIVARNVGAGAVSELKVARPQLAATAVAGGHTHPVVLHFRFGFVHTSQLANFVPAVSMRSPTPPRRRALTACNWYALLLPQYSGIDDSYVAVTVGERVIDIGSGIGIRTVVSGSPASQADLLAVSERFEGEHRGDCCCPNNDISERLIAV